MSSKRSSQHAIQLFPFLAVLMCALGALILLLLVITTRVREQARARAIASRNAAMVEAAIAPFVPKALPPLESWKPTVLPPVPRLHPSSVPVAPPPDPESLRDQWARTVAELQAKVSSQAEAVESQRQRAEAEAAALRAVEEQLAEQQRKADGLTRQRSAAQLEHDREAARHAELQRTIAQRESDIKQLKGQQAQAASRYSVLAYDGRSGTVRRPIYIECTETGLRFASENITLTPEQLDGFPALHNPLIAGADALIDYWSLRALKDPETAEAGRPYVLLIVRPSGTVGYYVARRMLDTLKQQYGYELVSETMEFAYPPTDAGAVAACRAAIDAALQDRGRFVAGGGGAAPGSLEPLTVTDGSGTFALDEVDQLRGGGRMVYFGGREVQRSPGGSRMPGQSPGRSGGGFPPQTGSHTSGSAPGNGAATNDGMGDQLAQSGARGAGSPQGIPATTGAAAAAEAANSFSEAAAARGRRVPPAVGGGISGGEAGTADDVPRPLPSLGAIDAMAMPSAPAKVQNPGAVLRDPGSQIGMERKVQIRVEPTRIVIESELPIEVTSGMSRDELQAQLAVSLRSHFQSWGRPPRSFYWLPQIKLTVLPGGHQHAQRMLDFTKEWDLACQVDYALE